MHKIWDAKLLVSNENVMWKGDRHGSSRDEDERWAIDGGDKGLHTRSFRLRAIPIAGEILEERSKPLNILLLSLIKYGEAKRL